MSIFPYALWSASLTLWTYFFSTFPASNVIAASFPSSAFSVVQLESRNGFALRTTSSQMLRLPGMCLDTRIAVYDSFIVGP